VTQPKSDFADVARGLQTNHRARVAHDMGRDALLRQT
jgi:hypothetical protein